MHSLIEHFYTDEKGQATAFFVAILVLILGFMTFAVDVGFWMHGRTALQSDADAIALAAAQDLPDEDGASNKTLDWGDKNGISAGEVDSIAFGSGCSGVARPDSITVILEQEQPTFFARFLGLDSATIRACATANVSVGLATDGLLPLGFHEQDPYPGANPVDVCYFYELDGSINSNLWDNSCIIKIPSPDDSWSSGNAGAIRLDEGGPGDNYDGDCDPGSSGASEYEENIEDGSECFYGIGDEVTPKPGNMKGPTCTAFSDRIGSNSDTIEQVFGSASDDGFHRSVDRSLPRFGVVPIVTVSGNGSSADITITGFITVYINGACSGSGCGGHGNDPACVVVTPVKSLIYTTGVSVEEGTNSADNPFRVIRLVE